MNTTFNLLDSLFDELFPLLRSITGRGIEQSYEILGRHIAFDYLKVPSGTQVFDWVVPLQWDCTSATLTDPDGNIVADINDTNLSVVNYSEAVDTKIELEDLQAHLHSLEALPDAVPYVTSYYKRNWGFCLPDRVRKQLRPGRYHAKIDSNFSQGNVVIAEAVLPGESTDEILLSSYLCHPSMANNELSGPLALTALYLRMKEWKNRKYTYRFVFNPETIGSLCYLYLRSGHLMQHMVSGVVFTCVGGPEKTISYKMTRREDSMVDRLAKSWSLAGNMLLRPFTPTSGSDERQYCSPGFNLPMGQISKTVYGQYEGYHNSMDNKDFMSIESLVDSVDILEKFIRELDNVGVYLNLSPYGEPQLGKRDLYPNMNSAYTWHDSSDSVFDGRSLLDSILCALNYSCGKMDLLEISQKTSLPLNQLGFAANMLEEKGLFKFLGGKR